MTRRSLGLAASLACLCAAAAPAQAGDYGPWTVDVGLAVRAHSAHIGASSNVVDALPVVEAQFGTRLHVSLDDGIRWSALKLGRLAAGPVAEYRQSYDDKLPPRTQRLSGDVELGGFAAADLTVATLEGRLRKAVDGFGGASADLAFDSGLPLGRFGAIGVEVRSSYADRSYTRELFGRNLRPAPTQGRLEDYVTAGGQASYSLPLPHRFAVSTVFSDDVVLQPTPRRFAESSRQILGVNLVVTRRFGANAPTGRF